MARDTENDEDDDERRIHEKVERLRAIEKKQEMIIRSKLIKIQNDDDTI